MGSNDRKSITERYTEAIKDIITILAGIAGIGYALGFMVVNSYLMGWGITDTTLVKARYVSVGFLFLVHTSLILIPSALSTSYFIKRLKKIVLLPAARRHSSSEVEIQLDSEQKKTRLARMKLWVQRNAEERGINVKIRNNLKQIINPALFAFMIILIGIAASLGFFYLTFTDLWLGNPTYSFWLFLETRSVLLAKNWYGVGFLVGFLATTIASSVTRKTAILGIRNRFWLIPLALMIFLYAMNFYVSEIYPRSASALGGGDYFLVQLIPNKENEDDLAKIIYGESSYTPRWVWLLDHSDKSYYVLVPDADCPDIKTFEGNYFYALNIDKELVKGLIHYNKYVHKETKCR